MLSRCYGKNGMATAQDTEEFMGGQIPLRLVEPTLHALSEARREVKSPRASPLLSTYQAASDAERFENRSDIALAQVDGSMNQGG